MASEVKRYSVGTTSDKWGNVEASIFPDEYGNYVEWATVEAILARCEQAEATVAACKAAGFVDEKGDVRGVNGTLCLDDDGVIVADGATVYFTDEFGDIVEYECRGVEGGIPSGLFWSTRTAAEAARGGEQG